MSLGLNSEPNPVHSTPYLSKLFHSMEQNPSWEADSQSAGPRIYAAY